MLPSTTHINAQGVIKGNCPAIPDFLNNIIDKKVNKIALNVLETIIHYFCSHFYFSYRKCFACKTLEQEILQEIKTAISSRSTIKIIEFANEVIICNLSACKVGAKEKGLLINGKSIGVDPAHLLQFRMEHETESVIIKDNINLESPQSVLKVEILEKKTNGSVAAWFAVIDEQDMQKKSASDFLTLCQRYPLPAFS